MAVISNTCVTCSGSGFINGEPCGTCFGAGVVPAAGTMKFLIETLNGIVSTQKTQQEYLEKILSVVGGK